jgi:hypothetical protein
MLHLPVIHPVHLDKRRYPPDQITGTRLHIHSPRVADPHTTCQFDQTRSLLGHDRMDDLVVIASLSMVLMADTTPDHLRTTMGVLTVQVILCATASDRCMAAERPRGCLVRLTDVNGKTVNNGSTMSGLCEDRRETTDLQQDVRLRGILEIAEMVGTTVSESILEVTHYLPQWSLEECLRVQHWDRTTPHIGAICRLVATTRTRKGTTMRRSASRRL